MKPADAPPPHRKRRRSQSLEDSPVDIDTPDRIEKKKKKKKRREEEEEEEVEEVPVTIATNKTAKKKKKRQEEEEEEEVEEVPVTIATNKTAKKKKKKRQEEEEEEEVEEVPVTIATNETAKKKKKKNKNGLKEVSVTMATTDDNNTDLTVPMETSDTGMERKKKKKQEGSVVMVTTTNNNSETAPLVSMETNHTAPETEKKKKKKKKQEGSVVMVTTTNNSETDLLVSMETNHTAPETEKKKKKKKQEGSVVMVTTTNNNSETDPLVSMETNHTAPETEKKKKKKKDASVKEVEKEQKKKKKRKDRAEKEKKKTSPGEEVTSYDEALVGELEEFIPDVKKRTIHEIQRFLRYDLHRFKEFKRQGVQVRWGRCTEKENQLIGQNIADFLALTGIGSANQLLFPERFPDQKAEIKQLRSRHHFIEKISEGIPRPCQQILTRAKKIFDDRNHRGRFSEEEMQSLIKLQNLHGNNWRAIAQKMDRSIYALQKRFEHFAEGHGPWSPEEDSRLKQALKAHLEELEQQNPAGSGVSRDQLCNNLPWKEVSRQVQTRSWTQCRVKWFCILKEKMSARGGIFNKGSEGFRAKIRLINKLYDMHVDDTADIDWDEAACAVGDVTPLCVQKSFHRLKVTRVPNWTGLPYGEIIDFLHLWVIPELHEKLTKAEKREALRGEQQEAQQEEAQEEEGTGKLYLLEDIFPSQEEDFTEVDNV
ncbi:transcription termination factor 1-like [Scomber japonicus]|uniref:transcription termination factor 1-like n=1 Tax=Scomber japonicus TaxID=13676 RepID=UPI002304E606|nr:transcription termination factor 1-like [Scomber japonicus]